MKNRLNAPTRYLAARAFLNGTFARSIRHIKDDPFKAKAPNYGVDFGVVAQAAEQARARSLLQHFLIFLCASLPALWALDTWNPAPRLWLCVIVSAAITLGFRLSVERGVVAKRYCMFSNWIPEVSEYESVPSPENQNLIVYSGPNPFVGAGQNIGGWTLAVEINKPKIDTDRVKPIIVEDFENTLTERVCGLGIEGLRSRRVLCAEGRAIRGDRDLLPNPIAPPLAVVGEGVVTKFSKASEAIRPYHHLRIHAWDDQLVVSVFHCARILGQKLFIDTNYFVLPPLGESYRAIDSIPRKMTFRHFWQQLSRAFIMGVVNIVWSPLSLLISVSSGIEEVFGRGRMEREVRDNEAFDYGVGASLREKEAGRIGNYFQMIDRIGCIKVIEKELLNATIDYLDERGIDTSELKDREATILNTGIMISGGNFTAQSVAAGSGAQAVTAQGVQALRNTLKTASAISR